MTPNEDGRPDPDALLAAIAPPAVRGRLKIFLGAAPGVGKTFEMLAQAHRRAAAGVDVLAGLIETHGRAETAAQIGDLSTLPRRQIAYRGRALEEFDLEAALLRRPGLLLLDELAHTNVPGSRHAKRWEDAADLLDAGIDVWTTLNVQHLESLNDDVARITGIRPAETLPDRVLDMADEIELVDLPPAELRARLREGRVYRPDQAARALDNFFREGNLAALREMALRRAAAHVDGAVREWMRRTGVSGPWPASEAILALVGADGSAEAVVRHASRLAAALRAPWTALHIERGTETEPPEVRRALALAGQLGAGIAVEPASGRDLPAALAAAAAAANATHVVLGQSQPAVWRRLSGRTLAAALLRQGPGFALHLVPRPGKAAPSAPPVPPDRPGWLAWAAPPVLVVALTAIGLALRPVLPVEAADMVYLAVVVGCAMAYGRGPALLAAALGVLAWDFFFIPPLYTVTIERPRDLVTAVVFGAVAVLTGNLAGRARMEARAAQARVETLRRISEFSRRLAAPATEAELLPVIAEQAALLGEVAVVLLGTGPALTAAASAPAPVDLDETAWAAARWAAERAEQAGLGTATLPAAALRFLPLRTARAALGVFGVRLTADAGAAQLQALEALADQAAVAVERVRLAADAAAAAALRDTQGLRTALLASLSHDLRTPLSGIQGAAGTLRGAWNDLPEATRQDLLASIEQDVGRMGRFLANISDLTRLETGEIRPRTETVALLPIVEAAIARLPDPLLVGTRVDPALTARVDPALLEQALFNVLDNAVKYSPRGGTVSVAARATETEVVMSVADGGVGIPVADLPHVFDSFFRARRGDRTAPGTGLGLAIARGLLEAMGGAIAAISPNPDAPRGGFPGTVMRITVPRA